MKLAIFGATGATGQLLVEQALDQGHHVTAFARNPAAVTTHHARFSIVKGDVLNPTNAEEAVANQDAILSAIGGHDRLRTTLSKHPRQAGLTIDGTRNIIAAMKKYDVSRLICLTAWGVGDSKDRLPFVFKHIILPLLMKEEYADKAVQEQLIQQSALDWTIIRPSRLTNGLRTGNYRMSSVLEFTGRSSISRADVADCMLKQLSDSIFRQKCLEVSY